MTTRIACRAAAALCSIAILAAAFAQPAAAPQAKLALPRPATLYAAGPDYAWVHPEVAKDPTDPKQKIVTYSAHVHRLADGKYWLWYKWNRGYGQGLGVAVSDDGVKFSPSPLGGMNQVPMFGEGYRPHAMEMLNLPDGRVLACYTSRQYDTHPCRIDVAVGTDWQNWKVLAAPALASSGQTGDGGPADPCVVKTPAGYRMYYVRKLNGLSHVFAATSTDGIKWTIEPQSVLTNGPQLGIKDLGSPTVLQVGPAAYFMVFAANDAAGKNLLGMAVSADGKSFQYLGSLGQIVNLSAFSELRSPQLAAEANGAVRLYFVAAKPDGTSGMVTTSLPAAAVTCVQAPGAP